MLLHFSKCSININLYSIWRDEKQIMNGSSRSKNNMPLISVIVPVYNVEEYLKQCVDSILSQTLREIEIILVDDGSTDKCPLICDEYAESYERICVIHQENKGVSAARNAGLRLAKGEYIAFIDSDDRIAPEYLSIMLKYMVRGGMSACGYICEFDPTASKKTGINEAHNYETVVMDRTVAQASVLCGGNFDGHLFCKLFDSRLIHDNNISFREDISYSEDGLFVIQYLHYLSAEVKLIKVSPYYYQYRSQSATNQRIKKYYKFDPHFFSENAAVEESLKVIEQKPALLRCDAVTRVSAEKAALALMSINGWQDTPNYKPYLRDMRSNLFKYLKYNKDSLSIKLCTVLCAINPKLYFLSTKAWIYICNRTKRKGR